MPPVFSSHANTWPTQAYFYFFLERDQDTVKKSMGLKTFPHLSFDLLQMHEIFKQGIHFS